MRRRNQPLTAGTAEGTSGIVLAQSTRVRNHTWRADLAHPRHPHRYDKRQASCAVSRCAENNSLALSSAKAHLFCPEDPSTSLVIVSRRFSSHTYLLPKKLMLPSRTCCCCDHVSREANGEWTEHDQGLDKQSCKCRREAWVKLIQATRDNMVRLRSRPTRGRSTKGRGRHRASPDRLPPSSSRAITPLPSSVYGYRHNSTAQRRHRRAADRWKRYPCCSTSQPTHCLLPHPMDGHIKLDSDGRESITVMGGYPSECHERWAAWRDSY